MYGQELRKMWCRKIFLNTICSSPHCKQNWRKKSIKVSRRNPSHHKEIRTKQLFWTKLARFLWLFCLLPTSKVLCCCFSITPAHVQWENFLPLKLKFGVVFLFIFNIFQRQENPLVLVFSFSISHPDKAEGIGIEAFMVCYQPIRNWGLKSFSSLDVNPSLGNRFAWIYFLPFQIFHISAFITTAGILLLRIFDVFMKY